MSEKEIQKSDSVPSHLLWCLTQVEEYVRLHEQKKEIKVYVIINNGFFQGKQNVPAIEVMMHWAEKCGFCFGQALGVAYSLKKMAEHLAQMKSAGTVDRNSIGTVKTFELNYPAWAYKWQAEYGWRLSAKKNGLKRKDLDKQW